MLKKHISKKNEKRLDRFQLETAALKDMVEEFAHGSDPKWLNHLHLLLAEERYLRHALGKMRRTNHQSRHEAKLKIAELIAKLSSEFKKAQIWFKHLKGGTK